MEELNKSLLEAEGAGGDRGVPEVKGPGFTHGLKHNRGSLQTYGQYICSTCSTYFGRLFEAAFFLSGFKGMAKSGAVSTGTLGPPFAGRRPVVSFGSLCR